jgi:hypothetical protein
LNLEETSQLKIYSLAPNPYEPQGKASKVATFTFNGVSKNLSVSRKEWTFTIPEGDQIEEDSSSRQLQISIDIHFEGFTPMNAFEIVDDHKIE